MSVHIRRSTIARERPSTLEIAADVLVADATASLAEVAKAAGIGRTTLHKHYPTRQALLVAVAHDSLRLLENAIEDARLDDQGESAAEALRRMIELLVPLGSRIAFLLRQPSLDAEVAITERFERVEEPVNAFVERAQQELVLRPELPVWWVANSLYSFVYTAWEGITLGKLAPLDAPGLALDTALAGLGYRR
ncbi:TetR/AcrR family transcriptional regulator [Amycolatopsis nigrescens]|uniref:TetR/AcrR family transcriptional regulator n=1 Tax=Amycolatopsis nigrescens TaxID=381445 RepID=UPI0003660884|nr:TetR/AcrR family transcriptional regulator [Amycolatopsis nigrescens]